MRHFKSLFLWGLEKEICIHICLKRMARPTRPGASWGSSSERSRNHEQQLPVKSSCPIQSGNKEATSAGPGQGQWHMSNRPKSATFTGADMREQPLKEQAWVSNLCGMGPKPAASTGQGQSQQPLPEQVWVSNLYWNRPQSATSIGAGLSQWSLRNRPKWHLGL